MTKGIAAERGRSMARMLEYLLSLGAQRFHSLKGGVQVVYMKVEMNRRPMALEFAPIKGTRRRS